MKKLFFVCLLIAFPAMAQRAPQAPDPYANCIPLYTMPVDIEILPLMTDDDGDAWIRVRVRNTGKVTIGHITKHRTLFCPKADGKVNAES